MRNASTVIGIFHCLVLGSCALACGSKGAVALTARIDEPSLSVATGVLGPTVSGGFELVLSLGDFASRATTVQLGSFALKRDDGVLIESLAVSTTESFPVSLEPGDETRIACTFEEAASAGDESAICAGAVRFSGTLTDSSSDGKPTLADSSEFQPVCP